MIVTKTTMEFENYIRNFLNNYPKNISSLNQGFEDSLIIKQLRKDCDYNLKKHIVNYEKLIKCLTMENFEVIGN